MTRAELRAAAALAVTAIAAPVADAPVLSSRRARREHAAALAAATATFEVVETESTVVEPVVAEVVESELLSLARTEELVAAPVGASTEPILLTEVAAEALTESIKPDAQATSDSIPSEPAEDSFAAAARLFNFGAEVGEAVPSADQSHAEEASVSTPQSTHLSRNRRARRASGWRSGRPVGRLAAASFSIGVMGVVGMLAVAVGNPAEAVAAAAKTAPLTSIQAPAEREVEEDAEIQAFVTPEIDIDLGRSNDTYSMATYADIAAATGITRHTNFFVNDPSGEIQWPFAVGVPISYGYGPRWGSFHYGLDFTPGEGADIQAVAAGTVRIANESGGAFGVHVMIDHEINGEVFSTHYAHMLYGSLQVRQGDTVTAGTVLGHVGDTGLSYGAHMHFEVFVNNQRIDPLAWLREHAGG